MNFTLTEDQLAIQQLAADFAKKEIAPIALELDKVGEFPWELYRKVVDIGLHCVPAPEEYGGPGLDTLAGVLIIEQLAKGCAGFADIIASNGLGAYPVLLSGTEEQKKNFFDIVVPGGLDGFCLTEPNAGSDASAIATTAVRDGDEYVLNGNKIFITNGSVASVYTVIASVDRSKGIKGLCAFLVERDRPGVSSGKHEDKMGIRCADTAEVIFDNVRIPASHLIGKEGEGFKIAMRALDIGRTICAAMSLGLAQSAMEHAVEYSKQRVQFGQPICENQGIQFILADMAIEIEAARQLTYYAAFLRDTNAPNASKLASMCKCFSSDIAMKVTTDAVQVFGGYGFIKEYPVEKLMRDAKIFQIFEGSNQIQRKIIAGSLLAGK